MLGGVGLRRHGQRLRVLQPRPARIPPSCLDDLGFEQPSIVYDRTGTIELARFGVLRRELVTFDQIPPEMIDATTAIEDKDFWTNPGFDIGAIVSAGLDTLAGRPRGASTITQQLVRARLLPADAFEGSVYDRKIREIIQSIRLTQAFPGEEGKKTDHGGVPQPELLRQPELRREGRRRSATSARTSTELTPRPVRGPRRDPAVTDQVRPDAQRDPRVRRGSRRARTCPADEVTLRVPDDLGDRQAPEQGPRLHGGPDAQRPLRAPCTSAADYEAAKSEPLILTPLETPPMKAPHFVWQIRKQLGALLCGPESAETCEAVDTGGYRS